MFACLGGGPISLDLSLVLVYHLVIQKIKNCGLHVSILPVLAADDATWVLRRFYTTRCNCDRSAQRQIIMADYLCARVSLPAIAKEGAACGDSVPEYVQRCQGKAHKTMEVQWLLLILHLNGSSCACNTCMLHPRKPTCLCHGTKEEKDSIHPWTFLSNC